ncbi:MAG: beta strand repeat-containing protein, partial [Pirellulales bacterium]
GASPGDVGVAAAVVVNIFDLTTHAYIADNANINQDASIPATASQSITVDADDNSDITSFAGALGASVGSVGVGAGLDLGKITKNTRAYIGSNAVVDAQSGVTVDADSIEDIVTLSTNLGAGNSVGVAGSASVYVMNTGTRAYVNNGGDVDAGGNVSITATGTFEITAVAGALGFGVSAGIGAANVTLTHTDNVEAWVGDSATVSADGTTGLTISATSSEEIIGTSAAGAGAGTAAVAGSATVLVLDETTLARIGRNATITADNGLAAGTPDVNVAADDSTQIVSVAGSLAASGTAAVGLGADVATITKTTQAYIDSNVTATVEGDILVLADSSEDITSVAAGLSASGGVSVAADAGVHVLDITTRAFIGDDPNDATPSAGAGNVHAKGSIVVAADDRTEIDKVVGVLAVATYAGIGAAAGVSTIDKSTEAFIGVGANITADGNTNGLSVRTGRFNVSYPSTGSTTPGIQAEGGVTVDSNASTLSAQGEVGLANLDSMNLDQQGGNDATDPSLTKQRTLGLQTRNNFRGLAVTATNRDDLETYTISLSGGIAGIAISAGVNVVKADTIAYIGANATVNSNTSGASSSQSVHVAAGDDFYHFALAGSLAGGVAAVSPAVGVTVLTNTTQAYVGSNATVDALNDVSIEAHGVEDILLVGFGIAAGVVGIGGAVDVLSITNEVTAFIGSGANVSAGGDVLVLATDDTDLDVISGALAGGAVGIGASVGVIDLDKTTQASIEAGAQVDAKGAGTGISGVLTGEKVGDGDSFQRATIRGVIVQANSSEDYTHFAVAAGVGFVGVA